MNIKIKTLIFEPGKKHLFLDISSLSSDTVVPLLYQCVETRSMQSFDFCLSQFHTRATCSGNICDFRTSMGEFLDSVVNRFTLRTLPNVNRKHFLISFALSPFAHKKTEQNAARR
jgi:hypothetical protein